MDRIAMMRVAAARMAARKASEAQHEQDTDRRASGVLADLRSSEVEVGLMVIRSPVRRGKCIEFNR
jgi:hypothetical protein